MSGFFPCFSFMYVMYWLNIFVHHDIVLSPTALTYNIKHYYSTCNLVYPPNLFAVEASMWFVVHIKSIVHYTYYGYLSIKEKALYGYLSGH